MWNYRACNISILQEVPNEARSIQRGQNNRYSLRKQHWNLHKITITTKSRGNFQKSPIHLSSESEPLKWSTFSSLIDISWEIDQNQAMKSLDLRTPCLAIQSARLLLSRYTWEKVIELKNLVNLWTVEKSSRCIHGLLWELCIQLITLAESDLIVICLWWRRQFEAESSTTLTTALSSAMFESSIPTGKEKIPRRWPWWFRRTPPIPESPGFLREEPSAFHLKLSMVGGDHITLVLVIWILDQRIRPSADLNRSEGE